MKKLILPSILIIVLIAVSHWYFTKKALAPTEEVKTAQYSSSQVGISFTYPKILTASTTAGMVTLHHEVKFSHHDFCDFKGEGDTVIPTLTDFNASFHIQNKSLIEAMKTESPYIPEENFVNGQVVPSPGFIDTYDAGELKGYSIFEGAEGCGHTIYYFPISNNKTLIIVSDLITVFTGAIDVDTETRAKAVPGVITNENANEIFKSILGSIHIL